MVMLVRISAAESIVMLVRIGAAESIVMLVRISGHLSERHVIGPHARCLHAEWRGKKVSSSANNRHKLTTYKVY